MTDTAAAPELGFDVFDADNHYYEATDAFTRHLDPAIAQAGHAVGRGRRQDAAAGRRARSTGSSRTPGSTPSPSPGASTTTSGAKVAGDDIRAAFGELEPISPAYRDRDARLAVMDAAGHRRLLHVPDARRRHGGGARATTPTPAHAAFRAFNRWLDDDWGLHLPGPHLRRAVPHAARPRPGRRRARLGARATAPGWCVMRAGPVMAPTGGRSPGDPVYDPIWAALAEAGVTVAYHSGESGYGRYAADWGESRRVRGVPPRPRSRRSCTATGPISDTMAALIATACSTATRTLRVATIESGSRVGRARCSRSWARSTRRSRASFRRATRSRRSADHVWVAPVLRGRHPRPGRHHRRRPGAVRLRLAPRRGPRRAGLVRRRPRRLHRRRGPPDHARQHAGAVRAAGRLTGAVSGGVGLGGPGEPGPSRLDITQSRVRMRVRVAGRTTSGSAAGTEGSHSSRRTERGSRPTAAEAITP